MMAVAPGTLAVLRGLCFDPELVRPDDTSFADEVSALGWYGVSLSTHSANAVVLIILILYDHSISLTTDTRSTFVRRTDQTITTKTEQMARSHSCDLLDGSNASHFRGKRKSCAISPCNGVLFYMSTMFTSLEQRPLVDEGGPHFEVQCA